MNEDEFDIKSFNKKRILNALGLNAEAQEFLPRSLSEKTNGENDSDEISALQSSFMKLSLNGAPSQKIPHEQIEIHLNNENKVPEKDRSLQSDPDSMKSHFLESPETSDRPFILFGEDEELIKTACADPIYLTASGFIRVSDLFIMMAQKNKPCAEVLASLSVCILEADTRGYFSQIHFQKLRNTVNLEYTSGSANPRSYYPFIGYLYNFYSEVKEQKGIKRIVPFAECPPSLVLIELLVMVALDLLSQKELRYVDDIELLIFVMSAIDVDLQAYYSKLKAQLLEAVRDAFFSERASFPVRILLLQLIELAASKWRLSARVIHFYQKKLLKASTCD